MTKTNIAKRIVSIVLAMSIVLSFALVSVSAIPADYTVVGDVVTQDFEGSSFSPIKNIATGSLAISSEKAYTGSQSLKMVANSSGVAKVKIDESIAGAGANTWYMSFMYYTDNAAVAMNDLSGQEGDSVKYAKSAADANGWRKAVFKITTGSTFASYLAFGDYGNAGAVIYIDDLEFAKVDGFNLKQASVPAGATPVVTGIKDFDTDASTGIGVAMSIKSGSATKVGVTMEEAHWGESSYAIQGNVGNTGSATFYFHPRLLMPAYSTCDDVLPVGTYYFSYYVYSDVAVSTSTVSNIGSIVAPTSVPAGEWTKAEGVFTVAETKVNSGIFDVSVSGFGENAVYFDDFILAQITIDGEVALTAEEVEFDYDALDAATVTVTSPIKLKTAEVTAPEGVTVDSATVVDGELVIALSGVELGEEYELSVVGADIFNRAYEEVVAVTMPLAEAAPMTFVASSISDGAVVAAPVSTIYLDVEYALDPATLAGNVTIAGENATVAAATLVNDNKTIKVTLDGVLPCESYTLSVANVENTYGGVLTDSITFSTAAGDSYALDFEAGIPSQFAWNDLGYNGACNLSDNAYSGDQSVAILAAGLSMGYVSFKLNGIKPNTAYRVSFYYSSQYWGGNITGHSGNGTWTNSVISDTDKAGWKKITVDYTSDGESTQAGVQLYNFFAMGANGSCVDTVYIDDIKVQEIGSVSQPIMKNGGRYVSELGLGTTTVEIPVANANAKAYIVSYDAQGRMTAFVPAVAVDGAINLEWTANTPAYRTQIIVMDATTFAPLCDAFVYTMED